MNLPTIIDVEEENLESDLDLSNPRSLINLVPTFMKNELRYLQQQYFDMSNQELEDRLFPDGKPDAIAQQLQTQFWDEYDRVQRWKERGMDVNRICSGLGSPVWLKKWCGDKLRLAWLIRMPASYEQALAGIHRLSIAQMSRIMQLDSTTMPNPKLMEVQFKIAQHVDQRVKGAVVQKIEQKSLSVHMNAPGPGGDAPTKPAMTMSEIQRQLDDLKARSARLEAPAGVQVDLLSSITAKPAEPDIIEVDAQPRQTTGD